MGRIVAIGGGKLEDIAPLHKYSLRLTGKDNPNVLFIPTASRDDDKYISDFYNAFDKFNCEIKNLLLVKENYQESDIDRLLAWADLIYVGGGNVHYSMKVWEKHNLKAKLKSMFSSDEAVFVGQGSGCLPWFACGYSNSTYIDGLTDWQYIWVDNLLDFHHVAVCPHYTGDDIFNFDRRLIEKEVPGIGLSDNTAFVQVKEHTTYIGSKEDAKDYYLVYLNGELMKREIKMKYVDENGQLIEE